MSSTSGASPTVPPMKQIRFVNSEGQPPPKRRRINAACQTCRKRKTRCDGKRPTCTTCAENGQQCLGYASGPELKLEKDEVDPEYSEERRDGFPIPEHRGHNIHCTSQAQARSFSTSVIRDQTDSDSRIPRRIETENNRGFQESPAFSIEGQGPPDDYPQHVGGHRVPYFRYFGPTAIVPGFKQMVVSIGDHQRNTNTGSTIAMSPVSSTGGGSNHGPASSQTYSEPKSVDLPVYDRSDHLSVNRLVIHLVETFFKCLGCNYPFLQEKSFIRRVEERSVEPILVDAVCALAARFSDHTLLTNSHDSYYPKSKYGQFYAQRAKAAVVETFPCPSIEAVQACLLLAYEGFGANQDSALWMYLGCAIRMAVDLGLQKIAGVKHQGAADPTYHISNSDPAADDGSATISAQDRLEIEQQRIDTLWAVFMLDRVISSGTGRPVTLRDEDFEHSFPAITANLKSGWPNPFPALIQIIHLYGRVCDLLNNIKNVRDAMPKRIEGLSVMEKDLTQFYQKLDQRLNFNAGNFQHYVKCGEGTNFILVHFWFHTLIMLLHQPTLMHSLEGQILQLLPNSRELSMSSAKTIADILAFAELIDPKSFIGNPFTTQPIYIAACAFLMESAYHTSQPTSRDASPPPTGAQIKDKKAGRSNNQKQKHSLLASAANQNYQRCYKALQQLETYWAGTRYILVALDQKAKGIWDPETYTKQELESTKIKQDMIPTWRRKLSLAGVPSPGRVSELGRSPRLDPGSPAIDPAQAIGWSLTGTTNSPSSNLTFMYQNLQGDHPQQRPSTPNGGNMIYDPIRASLPDSSLGHMSMSQYQSRNRHYSSLQQHHQSMPPPGPKFTPEPASASEAQMLLSLQNSPYQTPGSHRSFEMNTPPAGRAHHYSEFQQSPQQGFHGSPNYMNIAGVGDMMMESQEIDMSTFSGDMMPWLEYLPQDTLQFFDGGGGTSLSSSGFLEDQHSLDNLNRSDG